jgi:hypothetical protein
MIRIPWTQNYIDEAAVVLLLMALHTAVYAVTGLNLLPPIPWVAVISGVAGLIIHGMLCCLSCLACLYSHFTFIFDLFKFCLLFLAGAELRNGPGTGHPLYICVLIVLGVLIADMLPRFQASYITIACIAVVFLFACILDLTIALVRTMRQVDALVYRRNNEAMQNVFLPNGA